MRSGIFGAVLFLLSVVSWCDGMDRAEAEGIFDSANSLFAEANETAVEDPEAARDLYGKTILLYRRISDELSNPLLEYNLGNAYYRQGDIGRAILSYRRALVHRRGDANLRNNLVQARAERVDRIDAVKRTTVARILLFWHHDLSPRIRALLFAVAVATGCAAVSVHLLRPRPLLVKVTAVAGVIAGALMVSLGVDSIVAALRPEGVIVTDEVIARKGDGEIYEVAFDGPLHSGTEVTLREDRGGWLYVEIADGRLCWVPARSVELIGRNRER